MVCTIVHAALIEHGPERSKFVKSWQGTARFLLLLLLLLLLILMLLIIIIIIMTSFFSHPVRQGWNGWMQELRVHSSTVLYEEEKM